MVDPATGAGTRDALRRDLELERAAAAAAPGPIVLILRVAGLDQVRLTMGEPAAEAVLKSMVEVAPFALRARDRIYRSGPSEMVLLLPGADIVAAKEARAALESALGKVLAGRGFPELRLEARALQPVAEAS
jgi:GGDEF domain-containing protein